MSNRSKGVTVHLTIFIQRLIISSFGLPIAVMIFLWLVAAAVVTVNQPDFQVSGPSCELRIILGVGDMRSIWPTLDRTLLLYRLKTVLAGILL